MKRRPSFAVLAASLAVMVGLSTAARPLPAHPVTPVKAPVGKAAAKPATAKIASVATASGAAEEAISIDWRVLAGLDYTTGKQTDSLKKLEGKLVRIPGFVVPLDDFQEDGAEFLL